MTSPAMRRQWRNGYHKRMRDPAYRARCQQYQRAVKAKFHAARAAAGNPVRAYRRCAAA